MTMIIIIGKRKHVFKTWSDPHKLPSYVTYKGLTQGQEEGEDEDVNKLSQVSAINVCLNERILWRNLQRRTRNNRRKLQFWSHTTLAS